MSSESIRKGQRWFSEIGARLEKTNFAILCITPQNLKSQWMHFEAGAASKSTSNGYVSALLLDTAAADLELPLSQFQHTPASKDEIFKLLLAIDEALGAERRGEAHVKTLFDKFWPDLEAAIKEARQTLSETKNPAPKRSDREILEGILDAQQGIVTRIANLETQLSIVGNGALAALSANPYNSALTFGAVPQPQLSPFSSGLLGALSSQGESEKLGDWIARIAAGTSAGTKPSFATTTPPPPPPPPAKPKK